MRAGLAVGCCQTAQNGPHPLPDPGARFVRSPSPHRPSHLPERVGGRPEPLGGHSDREIIHPPHHRACRGFTCGLRYKPTHHPGPGNITARAVAGSHNQRHGGRRTIKARTANQRTDPERPLPTDNKLDPRRPGGPCGRRRRLVCQALHSTSPDPGRQSPY